MHLLKGGQDGVGGWVGRVGERILFLTIPSTGDESNKAVVSPFVRVYQM